jgi:hypothetical protein
MDVVTGVLAVVPIFTVNNRSGGRWAIGVLAWWIAVAIFAHLSSPSDAHPARDTPGMVTDAIADIVGGVFACVFGGLGLLAQLMPKREPPSALAVATARATSAERAPR